MPTREKMPLSVFLIYRALVLFLHVELFRPF